MNNQAHLFIVGNPLSGSSMLYRLLSYHYDLAWISQWSLRDGIVGERKKIPFARMLDKETRRFEHPWSKATYMRGLKWFVYRVIPSPADGGNIWEWVFPGLCQNYAFERDSKIASGLLPVNNHGSIDDVKRRLNHVISEITCITNRKIFIGKRPILAYVLPIIKRVLPQSRFVHIVRDPRAFVLSWIKKNWEDFQETKEISNEIVGGGEESAALLMTRYWINTVNYIADQEKEYSNRNVMTVRYEDLIADVHDNVQGIFKFAGLPEGGIDLTRFPKTIKNTNDKYFNNKNGELLGIIENAADGIMQRYQYDKLNL